MNFLVVSTQKLWFVENLIARFASEDSIDDAVCRTLMPLQIRVVRIRFLIANIAVVWLGARVRSHMQIDAGHCAERFTAELAFAWHFVLMNQAMHLQIGQSIECFVARRALELFGFRVYLGHVTFVDVNIGKHSLANFATVFRLCRSHNGWMGTIHMHFERTQHQYVAFVTNVAFVDFYTEARVDRHNCRPLIRRTLSLMMLILAITNKLLCTMLTLIDFEMGVDVVVAGDSRLKIFITNVTFEYERLFDFLDFQ